MRTPATQRGVSMIEVIVSLAVLAAVLLAMTQGLRASAQSTRKSDALTDYAQDVMTTRRILGEWLGAAQAQPLNEDNVTFAGSESRLTFVTLAPSYPTVRGFYDIALTARALDDGAFVLEVVRKPFGAPDEAAYGPRILLRSTTPITISYRPRNTSGREAAPWREDWPSRGAPPGVVRLAYADLGGRKKSMSLPVGSAIAIACLSARAPRGVSVAEACR